MEDLTKEELIQQLQKKESEIQNLKLQLQKCSSDNNKQNIEAIHLKDLVNHNILPKAKAPLSNEEVSRYSRQLILPEIGPRGQKKLSSSSVLIVGCGGLGCPAAIYLAASGIGRLGLVDYDEVEASNLHRQVLHTEKRVGMSKSVSAACSVQALNANVEVVPYELSLASDNAQQVISKYDIVLDCTDNVATRYLLNDACVMANKPLVSGSALRYEGQLTVYHYKGGPCFRCIHPKPPPPETVTNCSDGGVLGVIPGTIGVLQALEAIKIIADIGAPLSQRLLLFDGLGATFRTVKLRGHKDNCAVCGDNPVINKLIDYEQFCGAAATDKDKGLKLLGNESRVRVEEYRKILLSDLSHMLIDVRLPVELEICALPNCINIPLKHLDKKENIDLIKKKLESTESKSIFCICRRGNDSQLAVQLLQSALSDTEYVIKDIVGGLTAWARTIDSSLPVY